MTELVALVAAVAGLGLSWWAFKPQKQHLRTVTIRFLADLAKFETAMAETEQAMKDATRVIEASRLAEAFGESVGGFDGVIEMEVER